MFFADAHLHPAKDSSDYIDLPDAVFLLCCAASRNDWDNLRTTEDPRLIRFYGIHPWYAEEWNSETENKLCHLLNKDGRAGVGEIGLDKFRKYYDIQRTVFSRQLDIAVTYRRTVEIHNAGCDEDLLHIMRDARPAAPVVLHSFGSESYIRPLDELGCYFSINPRILKRSSARVSKLISGIPEDRLLLETDYPSVPCDFKGMNDFAKRLSESCGIPYGRLIEASLENARRIAEWKA